MNMILSECLSRGSMTAATFCRRSKSSQAVVVILSPFHATKIYSDCTSQMKLVFGLSSTDTIKRFSVKYVLFELRISICQVSLSPTVRPGVSPMLELQIICIQIEHGSTTSRESLVYRQNCKGGHKMAEEGAS